MRFLLLFFVFVSPAFAVIRNVPADYATVELAIAAAQPGDTVSVGAGTYNENITTDRAGTELNRITIDGNNVATFHRISFSHPYITLKNVQIAGAIPITEKNHINLYRGAHFTILDNVTVDCNSIAYIRPLAWQNPLVGSEPFGTTAASDCIIRNCVLREVSGTVHILLHGARNIIEDNVIGDSNDADFFNAFGEDHIIRRNTFRNIVDSPGVNNHPDFFQSYGTDGWGIRNTTIERNIVENMTMSGSQIVQLESSMIVESGNIVLRNNIFKNIVGGSGISIPGVQFYNNVFWKCGTKNLVDPVGTVSMPFTWSSRPYFLDDLEDVNRGPVHPSNPLHPSMATPIESGNIVNGYVYRVQCAVGQSITYNGVTYADEAVFFGTGTTTYTESDPANKVWRGYISSANNGKAYNNAFIECGDGTARFGWYSYEKTVIGGVATVLTGMDADYNYVGDGSFVGKTAGTVVISNPAYDPQKFYELHGINGGNPGFTDFAARDFTLTGGSMLIDAGVTVAGVTTDYIGATRPAGPSPDIGAYEYTAIEYDYHVATDGNDANDGSLANPFLTIAHAISVAQPGETIYVEAGTYNERVSTARAGTAGNEITLLAAPGVTMKGINISHAYTIFDGFTVTGYSAASVTTAHINISSGGDNSIVRNCTVTGLRHIKLADISFTSGTDTISSPTGGFSSIGITAGDTIFVGQGDSTVTLNGANDGAHTVLSATDTSIVVGTTLATEGPKNVYISASCQYGLYAAAGASNVTVTGNTFTDLNYDAMLFAGSNGTVSNNTFTLINGWDCMHYGGSTNTFSGNYINSTSQTIYQGGPDVFENWTPDPYTNITFENNFVEAFAGVFQAQKGAGTMSGLVIRGNVIANCGWMAISHPNTTIESNTFFQVAKTDDPTYSQEDYVIRVREDLGATNAIINNNVFFDCGDIGGGQTQADVGWYLVNSSSTFSASGNYASGPSPSFGSKTGWPEGTPALNGGDPGFADASDLLGADNLPFTADDGLALIEGSRLVDSGVGGADIGAYSFTPSGGTSSPPTVIAASINGATLSITFSEDVTEVSASDWTLSTGALSSATGSGASWTMVVTPAATFGSDYTISYTQGSTQDGGSNLLENIVGRAVTNNTPNPGGGSSTRNTGRQPRAKRVIISQ